MLKISPLFINFQTSRANNSKFLGLRMQNFQGILFRVRPLSMYEGGPEAFCGGHEIY